jgi:hypothetical protein
MWSPLGKLFGDDANGSPPSSVRWLDEKRNISLPTTDITSMQSERPLSREIIVRQATSTFEEASSHTPTTLPVPDETEELEDVDDEDEDDSNFAADPSRILASGENPPIPTPLSPPSVGRRSTTSRPSSTRSKALPDLPHSGRGSLDDNESPLQPMLPAAMLRACGDALSSSPTAVVNMAYAQQMQPAGSTAMTSPTASYFDFSDDEDEDDDDGANSADEVFIDSPASQYALASADAAEEDDYDDDNDDDDDDWRIKKHAAATAAVAALSQAASRRTFGGLDIAGDTATNEGTALDDLRRELGYLGGMIVSK